jgi:putative cardiolipin synthase
LILVWLAGCASHYPAQPSQLLPGTGTALGRQVQAGAVRHPPAQSGFRLLSSSADAFAARVELIRAAQRSLDLQYYIIHNGLSTRLLLKELLAAADRGVRVRLLLDDTASDGRDARIATLAAHPNVQLRLFNPLELGRGNAVTRTLGRLFDVRQQQRRMHNKLWLADGSVAIVGGRNLGDEYFDARQGVNFKDIDLLGAGPVAEQLGHGFDEYWNSALSKPVQQFLRRPPSAAALDALRKKLDARLARDRREQPQLYAHMTAYQRAPQLQAWLDQLVWAPSSALWDAPSKVLTDEPEAPLLLTTQLAPDLQAVQHELVLISAYFVPAKEGMDYLLGRADAGVDVRLLTNALEATDVPAVHGGYAPYRRELLQHGVKLYELRRQPDEEPSYNLGGSSESSLHSKAMVLDRRKAFIGSFNFDPRSVLWNTEVGVLVDSPALAGEVRRLAIEGMSPAISYQAQLRGEGDQAHLVWLAEDHGAIHVLHREPGGWWRRFNAWAAEQIGLERLL